MSKYLEKLQELDKRVEVLGVQLKEAKEWCGRTIKQLQTMLGEHKKRRSECNKWNL